MRRIRIRVRGTVTIRQTVTVRTVRRLSPELPHELSTLNRLDEQWRRERALPARKPDDDSQD